MCRLSGIICALLSLLLLAKFVTRKLGLKQLDKVFMKNHMTLCILFLVTAVIHTVTAIPIIGMVSERFVLTGIAAMILGVAIIISGFFMKKSPKGIVWHRVASCLYLIVLMMH